MVINSILGTSDSLACKIASVNILSISLTSLEEGASFNNISSLFEKSFETSGLRNKEIFLWGLTGLETCEKIVFDCVSKGKNKTLLEGDG